MTIAHQRKILHWLWFLWEYHNRTLLYLLSRMPLFSLICFLMPQMLQIQSTHNLLIWLANQILWLHNSISSRIFKLQKLDFTKMELPRTWDHLGMSSQYMHKALVLPGMVSLLCHNQPHQPMVRFHFLGGIFVHRNFAVGTGSLS